MMRIVKYLVVSFFMFSSFQSLAVFAAEEPGPFQSSFLGTAAEGYDVVSYFNAGKAIEGNSDLEHKWRGVNWHFSSKANRDAFRENPEKFAPQYGGYCAYAVSQGYTASIDPEAWTIMSGKLYLNYSKNVQSLWEKKIPEYIDAANGHWPTIKKTL